MMRMIELYLYALKKTIEVPACKCKWGDIPCEKIGQPDLDGWCIDCNTDHREGS